MVFTVHVGKQKKIMKRVLILPLLALCSLTAFAQSENTNPAWISKDVQKIQYRNSPIASSVVTTAARPLVSKGVAVIANRQTSAATSRVAMTGTPASVISKPVAKQQYEKAGR